jgi:hypothetical protein
MPFVNEVVSNEDIDRYGLPFEKGSGRYWTRDAERDFYLWGGNVGNPAFGEPIRVCFRIFLAGDLFTVFLEPPEVIRSSAEKPLLVSWQKLLLVSPTCPSGPRREELKRVLKEALVVYGEGGRGGKVAQGIVVKSMF